jgi:TatA/E family protein of Tat protein translocase
MFGSIGIGEILVILAVALLVLGPDKLPGVMRSAGKILGDLRRASGEFQRTFNADIAPPPPPPSGEKDAEFFVPSVSRSRSRKIRAASPRLKAGKNTEPQ